MKTGQRSKDKGQRIKVKGQSFREKVSIFVLFLLFLLPLSFILCPSAADAYRAKMFNAMTGSGTYSLDAVSVASLLDGDQGFVAESGTSNWYHFVFVSAAVDAENAVTHPYRVRPDDYATNGVWYELGIGYFMDGISGGSIYVTTANFGTVIATEISGTTVNATNLPFGTGTGTSLYVVTGNFGSLTAPAYALGTGTGTSIYVITGNVGTLTAGSVATPSLSTTSAYAGTLNTGNGQVQEAEIDWTTGITPPALARMAGYLWTDTAGNIWIGNASGSVSPFWVRPAGNGVSVFGNIMVSGKIGVGVAPSYELDIQADGSATYKPILRLKDTRVGGAEVIWNASTYGGAFPYMGTTGAHPFMFVTNNARRLYVAASGGIATGVYANVYKDAGANNLVITGGLGVGGLGYASGVSIGGVDPISGITSFVAFAAGVSPVGSMTSGGILYCAGNELWVNDGSGTHTQISPHDPETGEWYHNSYNVYTGEGVKYYPLTAKTVTYSVPRIDPHEEARAAQKAAWVADYMASGAHDEEVLVAEAFVEVSEQVDDPASGVTTEKIRYELDAAKGKVKQVTDKIVIPGKQSITRRTLRPDCRFDAATGKIWRKPTADQAESAAFLNFTYKPRTLPQWIEEYMAAHPIEKSF